MLRVSPWPLALIGLAGAVLLAPSLFHGAPDGHSSVYNLQWFEAFHRQFWAGEIYPRRLAGLWYGAGGLDFFFYGPLPFWLSSLLGGIVCPACQPGRMLALGGLALLVGSGLAFYGLCRRWHGPWQAAAGGVIYMALPYHLGHDWYIRQAVGEFAVYLFLPLAVRGLIGLRAGAAPAGALLALGVGGAVLSHPPGALLLLLFLAVAGLWLLLRGGSAAGAAGFALRAAGWVACGIFAAAFYWLPALALIGDVSPDLLYGPHYRAVDWLFLDGRAEPAPRYADKLKLLLLLATGAAALALWGGRPGAPPRFWILAPLLFGWVLMTPLSWPLWRLPVLAAVQFPWRSLLIVDLGLALALLAALAPAAPGAGWRAPARRFGVLLLAAALFAAPLAEALDRATVRVAERGPPGVERGAVEYLPPPVVRAALPGGAARMPDRRRTAEHLRGLAEMPPGGRAGLGARFTLAIDGSRRLTARIEAERPGVAVLPVLYWRHWAARDLARDRPVPLRPAGPYALAAFDYSAGRSTILVTLPWHVSERAGLALSLAALAAALAVRRRRAPRSP